MDIDMIPLVSFVIITTFTPGPNNISSASMGLLYGYKRTVNYLIGIACGFFIVMIACAFLSNILLAALPVAEQYLRWIGAGYILWLAIGILQTRYSYSESNLAVRAFSKGFMLQLFNPKVAVYGLTLYSTFLASVSGHLGYLSLTAVLFALTAFAATSTWALFGSAIKEKFRNNTFKKMVNISLSLLLICTAADLSGFWK